MTVEFRFFYRSPPYFSISSSATGLLGGWAGLLIPTQRAEETHFDMLLTGGVLPGFKTYIRDVYGIARDLSLVLL